MGIDLQKEIKLSDLFRRKAKEPEADVPEAPAPKEDKPRRALFARKEKAPKAPKAPKEKTVRPAPKAAVAVPEIPLMRAFNLLPREEPRESGARLGLAQVLVALLGLLVVAGLGSAYLFMGARVSDKQAQVDDLRVQLADLDVPSEGPAEESGDAALAAGAQARTAALAGALTGRVAWDRVLREVTLVAHEDVWFTTVTARTPGAVTAGGSAPTAPADGAGNALTIVGAAESQDAVARFLARLGVVPELTDVQLQTSVAELQESGARNFTFTIVATVDPAGAPS